MLHIPSQDRSILMTTPPNDIKTEKSRGEDRLGDPENRKRKCDQCEKTGHTREKCWKLYGRPSRGDGRSTTMKSHAHMAGASNVPSQSYDIHHLDSQRRTCKLLVA